MQVSPLPAPCPCLTLSQISPIGTPKAHSTLGRVLEAWAISTTSVGSLATWLLGALRQQQAGEEKRVRSWYQVLVPFPPGSHYVLVTSLPQTYGSGAFLCLPNRAPSGLERLTLPYSCCFKCQCFPQASSDLYKLPLNVIWNSTSWGHVSVVDLRPEAVYVIPLHPFCKGWYDAKEGDE